MLETGKRAPLLKRVYWDLQEKVRETLKAYVDRPRICSVRGHRIAVNCSNAIEAFRAGTYASKEPETLDWLEENLKRGYVFFDVGANIGLYSLYAASIQPEAKIYSFEPESQNFSRLMKNIIANKFENRVTAFNVAIADNTDLAYLNLSQFETGSALHSFGEATASIKQGIFGSSLNDLTSKYSLPFPNLLKVDVDGIEDKIFAAAQNVLSHSNLKTVLVEIDRRDPKLQSVDLVLKTHGFVLKKSVVTDSKGDISNNIYVREKI